MLVCNQFWRHKNHLLLFRALADLRQQGHPLHVVCTGRLEDYRAPGFAEEVRRTLREGQLDSTVKLLGLIPRADQMALMRSAVAVVQPSRFEGWSTVVEDARSLGRPIVLSGIPVHREQCPPRAEYFDVDSHGALASALLRTWQRHGPGPDEEAEIAAGRRNDDETLAFAGEFLALARRA